MTDYKPDSPPLDVDKTLSEYIHRELIRISDSLQYEVESRLSLLERLIVELVVAGYSGMRLTTAVPSFTIPSTGWAELPYDTLSFSDQRGIISQPLTNDFVVTQAGKWLFNLTFNLEGHNSSNQGQNFQLRLYDENDNVGFGGLTIGVGRNTEDTLVSISSIFDILEEDEGHTFHVEVGQGSIAFTGNLNINNISMSFQSELGVL